MDRFMDFLFTKPRLALPGVCGWAVEHPLSCITFADKKRPKKISLSWYFPVFNLLRPPFYVEDIW
jgi:hypothetical protein